MGMPVAERRRWTAAQVRQLNAESPGNGPRYELIDGELLVTPAPRPRHQLAAAWLFERVSPYVQEQKVGRALWSPSDLELAPEQLTQPDVFVITLQRAPQTWKDVQRLALAIEVLSPSTARYDRTVKRRFYQSVGVPEYWIVDLDAQLVERWRPADERPEIITGRLEWRPDGATKSLAMPLGELWPTLA
jgi:Uma2 family endonuclease